MQRQYWSDCSGVDAYSLGNSRLAASCMVIQVFNALSCTSFDQPSVGCSTVGSFLSTLPELSSAVLSFSFLLVETVLEHWQKSDVAINSRKNFFICSDFF